MLIEKQPKQETLEEASIRAVKSGLFKDETLFIAGAKWQQERKYSEEDLRQAFFSGCQSERQFKPRIKCWEEWFEQFKKK